MFLKFWHHLLLTGLDLWCVNMETVLVENALFLILYGISFNELPLCCSQCILLCIFPTFVTAGTAGFFLSTVSPGNVDWQFLFT